MKRSELGLSPVRLRVTDLLRESTRSALRHPGRTLVTVVGTVLGAAAFVSTLGLGSTLNQQVSASFDVRRATEVVVQAEDAGLDPAWVDSGALARVKRLNGVRHAGRRVNLGERSAQRTAAPGQPGSPVAVIGADAEALRVMEPRLNVGRRFDEFHDRHEVPVILLAAAVAREIGVGRVGVAVFLDGRPYTVIGIYDDVARRVEALAAVIIPYSVADGLDHSGATAQPERDVVIATAPGAAQVIGRQAPLAIRPTSPDEVRAIAPPDPRTLRREIEGDVARSTILLSVVALLMGTISIGNAATAGIAARTSEIGLRRAMGGGRRHIFLELVTETSALGGLGGAGGAMLGMLITSLVSLANGWTPVIDLQWAAVACAVSTFAGTLAGMAPAARAVRVPPVQALQR